MISVKDRFTKFYRRRMRMFVGDQLFSTNSFFFFMYFFVIQFFFFFFLPNFRNSSNFRFSRFLFIFYVEISYHTRI